MIGVIVLVLVFLVLPIAELYVIVQSSHAIGFWNTLGLLIVVSVVGAWLVRHQGLRVWNRFNQQVAEGKVPSKEIADGVMILLAGALLLTPGFLTDLVGILLLLPPTRALLRGPFVRRMRARARPITATYRRYGPGPVIDVGRVEAGPSDDAGRTGGAPE